MNSMYIISYSYGTDNSATILDDVSCSSSNYLTLQQCYITRTISSTCSLDSNDAYVFCCKLTVNRSNIYCNVAFQILLEFGIILILVKFVYKEVLIQVMVDWKYIVMDSGVQYVMIPLV